jgi:hypothetical protein
MDLKRTLLLVPCESKEHLQDWFKTYLDFHIFDTQSSRFSTATPLDAAWEAYSFAVHTKEKKPRWYLFASARSTQKTITLAATEVAIMLHTKRNVLHYAGSLDQSEAGYSYVKQFLNRPYIRDMVVGDITASKTDLLIPNKNNQLWLDGMTAEEIKEKDPDSLKATRIKIMSISPMQTQGQHESVVGIDEIHTLKGEKAAAYKDIRKIPIASWDGKPWLRLGISSRKNPSSIVESEIESKDSTGLLVKQWTVFEGIEQCPSERNGGDFVHERYINIYDGSEKTVEEFNVYQGKDKDKYTPTLLASGCLTCPLRTVCQGDLAKPKPHNKHYQSIESAITDFVSDMDRDWYLAQCLSLQPSREGLIFSKFDRSIFEKTPTELYTIFTGTHPGKELTEEELIQEMLAKGIKAYAGLDHGYTDPMAISVLYEDSVGRIYVMKTISMTGLEPNQVVDEVRKVVNRYHITHLYPDTAQPAINKLIKKAKIVNVMDEFDKKDGIYNGIALIRNKITPIAGGETMFYGVKGNCDALCEEARKYHYITDSSGKLTDDPIDDYNHVFDSCRYAALNRWMKGTNSFTASNPIGPKVETKEEFNAKVQKDVNAWLDQEIKKSIIDNGGNVKSNSSKTKGFIWSID